MAGSFGSIFKAINEHWSSEYTLGHIPLWYGRADESDNVFPRAVLTIADFDTPNYAFNPSKYIDEFLIQFSVWDSDADNVASLIEEIHTTYHRQILTLDSGENLSNLRKGSQMLVDSKLGPDSKTIYIGIVRFIFRVDNKDN